MTTDYIWRKSYLAALLETDWTKMPDRLQAAESELREREWVLSEDDGGSEQERQAIVDAINGLKMLRRDVVEWQKRQSAGSLKAEPD